MRQEESVPQDPEGLREPNAEMERHMLKNTGTHLKYREYYFFYFIFQFLTVFRISRWLCQTFLQNFLCRTV